MPLQQLDAAYEATVATVRDRITQYAETMWVESPTLRDADVARMVSRLVPVVQAGQLQVANLTNAYITRLAVQEGVTARPMSVDRDSILGYRGVPAEEVYNRPAVTVYTKLAGGQAFDKAKAAGLARLVSIVSTDLQQARTRQAQKVYSGSGFEYTVRTLTGKENCALCVIASTQRYHKTQLLPMHPGCVPGDSVLTPVAGGSAALADFAWGQVEAVSRRMFQGELIEFVTARDDQVRVTPNHPVLTDKGWVPAHLLREGDTVFRGGGGERVVLGGPDVNERPALAQDVFDAARVAFPLVRVPLAAEDFHADRAEGEVEIVYTHGNFPTPRSVPVVERLREGGFVDAHGGWHFLDGGGSFCAFLPGGLAPLGGGVSGGGLGGGLFGGHLRRAEQPRGGTPARFDAPAGEFGSESAPVYASQGRNLVGRLAGYVESDRIVEFRRVGWSGHVFNLHTREGWYSSNNHIISNCDCGQKGMKAGTDPGQVLDPGLLEQTHEAVAAKFGWSDREARDIGHGSPVSDYLDLVVTHEHGELGPTLAWRGDHFTGPADVH